MTSVIPPDKRRRAIHVSVNREPRDAHQANCDCHVCTAVCVIVGSRIDPVIRHAQARQENGRSGSGRVRRDHVGWNVSKGFAVGQIGQNAVVAEMVEAPGRGDVIAHLGTHWYGRG